MNAIAAAAISPGFVVMGPPPRSAERSILGDLKPDEGRLHRCDDRFEVFDAFRPMGAGFVEDVGIDRLARRFSGFHMLRALFGDLTRITLNNWRRRSSAARMPNSKQKKWIYGSTAIEHVFFEPENECRFETCGARTFLSMYRHAHRKAQARPGLFSWQERAVAPM
jgi:hypothetical protein